MTDPLPPSPDDDAARRAAARTVALRLVRWGVPLLAVAALCLLLGVPWWLVAGGLLFFVAVILFDA